MVDSYIKDMSKRNATINPAIKEGFEKYSKAVDKVIKEDENRQKLIDIANSHIAELVKHVRTFILPTLSDPMPLRDFMNLLEARGDIRVAHYRFMTGLQRIDATNLYYPNITRDEMDVIAYELANIKRSIRNRFIKI